MNASQLVAIYLYWYNIYFMCYLFEYYLNMRMYSNKARIEQINKSR